MFIAFLIIAIIGILLGLLIFFYGLALFNTYINSAKKLAEEQKSNGEIDSATTLDNVSSVENADTNNTVEDEVISESAESDKAEHSEIEQENIKKRSKIFSPLPYFLAIEGAILFIFNVIMFMLKFYYPKFMEFYILAPVNVAFILVSVFIDAIVMSRKDEENNEVKSDNNIDKID